LPSPNDITELLLEWSQGEEESLDRLLPLVYDELRRLAAVQMVRERRDHTLQPTALVHEAFMRLAELRSMRWENRAHFFGAAARIMRRILVDHARKHRAVKRGSGHKQQLDDALVLTDEQAKEIGTLDDALQDLERLDERQARVVEVRYFGGFNLSETAEALGVSTATVKRDWAVARAWLQAYMQEADGLPDSGP
jgi:RNA polymerase sigma factor (TIGR02999 family)